MGRAKGGDQLELQRYCRFLPKLIFNMQDRTPMKTLALGIKLTIKVSICRDPHINKTAGSCWRFVVVFYKL